MKAICNGKIVMPDGVVAGKALVFDNHIRALTDPDKLVSDIEIIDAQGGYVLPGLIDIHIHGYQGEDASDGSFAGLRKMAAGIAKGGVTSFLPTTMTVSYEQLENAFAAIARAMEESAAENWFGARVLGAHAEGPFINPAKKGAQNEIHIRPGDAEFLKKHADVIRLVTIAPEMPGNLECIREMAETGMAISMGHTTATYQQAKAGFDAGIRHATHLFNAMSPLTQREPGAVGAALTDDRVSCEVIADGFHVNSALFSMVAKQKGDKMVIITDCLRSGGLEDGEYELGGQKIFVKGIECRLEDGTIAGSMLTMNRGVKNVWDATGLPLSDVVNMASLNPATVIGMQDKKGTLTPGSDADITVVNEDFDVLCTIVEGRTVYRR